MEMSFLMMIMTNPKRPFKSISTHLQWSVNPLTNGGGSGGIMGVWEFTIAASYQPKASQWGVCNSEVEESPQEIKVGNWGNNLFGKIFPTFFSVKQSQCNAVKWFHILIPTFHWTVVLRSNMYLQSDRSKPEVNNILNFQWYPGKKDIHVCEIICEKGVFFFSEDPSPRHQHPPTGTYETYLERTHIVCRHINCPSNDQQRQKTV